MPAGRVAVAHLRFRQVKVGETNFNESQFESVQSDLIH